MATVLRWANLIATGGMLVGCCIVIVVTFKLAVNIVRLCRSVERRSMGKFVTVGASLVTTVLYMISTIIFFIGSVSHVQRIQTNILTEWGGTALHLMSQTAMIFTFVSRVDISFRHSSMQYSHMLIRTLYVLSVFSVSFCVLDVVFMVLGMWFICYLTAAVWLLIFSVLSMILVYLFIRKMKVIVMVAKSTTVLQMKENSDESTTKEMIDEELLYLVTKHAVLIPFAIASSFVLELLAISVAVNVTYNDWVPVATFWIALDSVVNVLCNYLLFAFANPVYDVICSPLHRACTACQVWSLEKKMEQKDKGQEGEQDITTVVDAKLELEAKCSISLVRNDSLRQPAPNNARKLDLLHISEGP